MPDELIEHLRYPEDLFAAQNESYRLYHLPANDGGATTYYNQDDRWAIPEDVSSGSGQPMEPYYVIMRIPGEEAAEFVLIQPMVPEGRANMIAWVAARMDPGFYGERIAFRFPTDTSTQGPRRSRRASTRTTPSRPSSGSGAAPARRSSGATCSCSHRRRWAGLRRADLPPGRGRAIPRVRARDHGRPGARRFCPDVEEGLRQLLGEAEPPPIEEAPPNRTGRVPGRRHRRVRLPADVAGLVDEAQRLYDEAQAALDSGDLGEYQARIDELADVLEALAALTQ